MLLLEVLFCHLTSEMQHLLLRRWPPIKARMKNILSLTREEEECINSRRWNAVCQDGPADEET
jgi:hypothetical protein